MFNKEKQSQNAPKSNAEEKKAKPADKGAQAAPAKPAAAEKR